MNSNKAMMFGLALSTGLHLGAAGVLVVWPESVLDPIPKNEPIEISLVQYKEKNVPKKVKGKPVTWTRAAKSSDPATPLEPSELEKKLKAKIKKQEEQLLKLSADAVVPDTKSEPKSSSELLTDPVKGKIFVGYFGGVKQAIQELLVRKYAKKALGSGSVHLFFVLNDKGELEQVSVVDQESTADDYLRELALQCLREASPFGNFPQSLKTKRISFNVTIYFETP